MRSLACFAFASNMNSEQMLRRCPSARLLGSARLPSHRLAFGGFSPGWQGGVATVERAPGQSVWGVLYELAADDLALLDRAEGVPFLYRRDRVTVRDEEGRRRRAVAYVLVEAEPVPPSVEYALTILTAYRTLGFDEAGLLEAVRRSMAGTVASARGGARAT